MEFHLATGNVGTGRANEAQPEHGCDFAPVAGIDVMWIEILSAPYRLHEVSVSAGQPLHPVKAVARHLKIRKMYCQELRRILSE